jgi:putative transposase
MSQDGAGTAPARARLARLRQPHPTDILAHAAWLYDRFALKLRDVEELLYEHAIDVTHQAIRAWVAKFGPR